MCRYDWIMNSSHVLQLVDELLWSCIILLPLLHDPIQPLHITLAVWRLCCQGGAALNQVVDQAEAVAVSDGLKLMLAVCMATQRG